MSQDPHETSPIKTASPHEFRRTHSISGRSSSRKVRSLIDSMKKHGWDGPPVIVVEYAEEKYLLDGHHRVFAARSAKILVHYQSIGIDGLTGYSYDTIDQVIQAHAEAGVNRIRRR